MNTCTALNGQCAAGDYWFHESIRIPVGGGELYVAQYMGGPQQLLFQAGLEVRSVTLAQALELSGGGEVDVLACLVGEDE